MIRLVSFFTFQLVFGGEKTERKDVVVVDRGSPSSSTCNRAQGWGTGDSSPSGLPDSLRKVSGSVVADDDLDREDPELLTFIVDVVHCEM